jgi:hypothetical protein
MNPTTSTATAARLHPFRGIQAGDIVKEIVKNDAALGIPINPTYGARWRVEELGHVFESVDGPVGLLNVSDAGSALRKVVRGFWADVVERAVA